jgi:hypothetical protein
VTTAGADRGYTPLRSYRYERKFVADTLTPEQVACVVRLHPQMFITAYPPRYVNNLYFDTADLQHFYDNLTGASQRRKVRVRWYGELFGPVMHPLLEIKVKDGPVGTKQTFPLALLQVDGRFCDRYFRSVAAGSGLPEPVWPELRDLNVVLLNRYYRHYYASRDGRFRVTVDIGMTYHRVLGAFGNSFLHHQVNDRDVIVELKYEVDQEPSADRVAGGFPFRMTRNSKYVQGMERVYF